MIGLFIVIKLTESNDMMDIKFLTCICFCKTAFLASVIITLAGLASLASPIRAIVPIIPATPSRIIFTSPIFITAIGGAKSYTALAFSAIVWIVKFLATVGASHPMIGSLALWSSGCFEHCLFAFRCIDTRPCFLSLNYTQLPRFIKTFWRAYASILCPFYLRWVTLKCLFAYRTFQPKFRDPFACPEFVGTLTRTSCFSPVFQSGFVSNVNYLAYRTYSFYFFSHAHSISQNSFMGKLWDIGGWSK